MGCAPSKGKLFSKPEGPQAIEAEAGLLRTDSKPSEEQNTCLQRDEKEKEPQLPIEELPEETTHGHIPEEFQETEDNVLPEHKTFDLHHTEKAKEMERCNKNKGKKRSSEKKRKSWIVHSKVDFPPHMVRAHQAAYAFLNPNICKYEALLGLLDQAAQTHQSLQPMMSALALRFEEINQALEEMAEEGELMLKDHGDFMALPSGMIGPAIRPAKPSLDPVQPSVPPPDLLQQMLQQSTEKMKQVGLSAQALGDTALEEAVQYFSSLAQLLVDKMEAKKAAEQRLTRVIERVESMAVRKSHLEDSALHSEDSGIGGENESLTGSERHRRHRGSAGSGSSGSGGNIRGINDNPLPHLTNVVNRSENEEEEDDDVGEDDDDDNNDDEGDESEKGRRRRSNSSPPDPSQALCFMQTNYLKNQGVKRPLTSFTKPDQSIPVSCINLLLQRQDNHTNFNQSYKTLTEIAEKQDQAGPQCHFSIPGPRRHSLSVPGGTDRRLLRSVESSGNSTMFLPLLRNHTSVRRLINTFTQGVDGKPGHNPANVPFHVRRSRKGSGVLSSDKNVRGLVVNGNNSSWPDSRDDLDVDSLPPPPPEVLMDNSFQRTEGLLGPEDGAQSLPMINQKSGVCQRLKASVQNVDLLPNRASVKPGLTSILYTRPVRQDTATATLESDQQPITDLDPNIEKVHSLYQQARKIIHLRNSVESSGKKNLVNTSGGFYDSVTASCSLPVTVPPVSRVRLPPSCPFVSHRFPSPPIYRRPPASITSSRPWSPQTVTRASDKTEEEIIPSVSFQDARSVFCQNGSGAPPAPGSCMLPRQPGHTSQGRSATREADGPTRRTQSEQRPGVTRQLSRHGGSTSAQGGSGNRRPDSPVMRRGRIGSDSPVMSPDGDQ